MEQLSLFNNLSNEEKSIQLLREFELMALQLHEDGYYLAYSGGKDSDVLLHIAIKAGVKFTAHYNITGIDPKEAVIHIKEKKKELKEMGITLTLDRPKVFTTGDFKGLPKNMWRLIEHKKMPPTRIMRYCCSDLKEHGGEGRICLTGVRWAESAKRSKRRPLEVVASKFADKKLFNDNDEGRRQFENCMQKGKKVLNPIIQWNDEELWGYIRQENIKYCKLYDEGWDRIGCLGCPMGSTKGQEEDFKRYPQVKDLYIKAFDKMIEKMNKENPEAERNWKNGQDVFDWWLYSQGEKAKIYDNQIEME